MKNKLRLMLLVAVVAGLCNTVLAQSVEQGRKFFYYKRYVSAKGVFDKVLASNPNNIEAIYWQGQTLLALKDSVAAQDLYSKALQSNGNAPLLLAGMAGVELRFGKAQDARAHGDEAITLTKQKDVPVLNAVARSNIEASQGDLQYALQKLDLATNEKHFNDPETYVLEGDAYRRLIDGGNAVQAYQKALTMDPNLADAEYQIGKIYLTQNNKDYFLPAFEKSVQMDPAFAPAWYDLFYYYYTHFDVPGAKDSALNAWKQYVANTDPGPDVEYGKVDVKVVFGDFAGAKTDAQALITSMGDKVSPRMYKLIAYCCDTLGNEDCAMQNITTYFQKQVPADVIPSDYVLQATIQGKSPDSATREMAFQSYGMAIQKDTLPGQKEKYLGLATAQADKYNDKKALAYIARIVYMDIKDPTNSDLYKWGIANYQAGEYKTADSIFCGIYEAKYPTEIFGYLWCARAMQAQDDTLGSQGIAIPAWDKLAEVARSIDSTAKAANSPDSTKWKPAVINAYFTIASWNNDFKKDKNAAIEYLRKVLEVDPTNATATRYLKILTAPPRREPAKKGAGTR